MDEKLKELWEKNKILFFLLIPVVLLILFKDIVLGFLIGSARRLVDKSKEKDAELDKQAALADAESERLKAEAKELDDKIKNRDEDDISANWHKK